MGLNVILPLAGGLAVVAVLVVVVLMKNRTAYLGPVKEELQKEKAWLRRGEYNAAMVKGRQNLELLLKLVAEKNGIQLDNSAKAQADAREMDERRSQNGSGNRNNGQNRGGRKKTPKVMTHQQFNRWLSDNGYLDRVARWEMNQVRLIGNKAAHENYADKDDAWNQFNYLEDILKTITERSQNPKKRQEQNKKHEPDGADKQKSQGKKRQEQKAKAAPTQPEASAAEQEAPKKKKRRRKKKSSNKSVGTVATESAVKNVEKAVEVKQAETPAKPVKQEEKNDAAQAEVKKKSKRRRRRKKPQNANAAVTVEKRDEAVAVQESPKAEVKKAEPVKDEPTPAEGEPKPKKRRRRRKKPSGAGAQTTQEVKKEQPESAHVNVSPEAQEAENATVEKKPNPHKRRRRRRPRKPQGQNGQTKDVSTAKETGKNSSGE